MHKKHSVPPSARQSNQPISDLSKQAQHLDFSKSFLSEGVRQGRSHEAPAGSGAMLDPTTIAASLTTWSWALGVSKTQLLRWIHRGLIQVVSPPSLTGKTTRTKFIILRSEMEKFLRKYSIAFDSGNEPDFTGPARGKHGEGRHAPPRPRPSPLGIPRRLKEGHRTSGHAARRAQ